MTHLTTTTASTAANVSLDDAFGLPLTAADHAALKAKPVKGYRIEVWDDCVSAPEMVGLIPRGPGIPRLSQGAATWAVWRQADGAHLQIDSLTDDRSWTALTMAEALDSVARIGRQ